MELYFLALLILLMAMALGSGFPVAFALPGSAIITITLAATAGWFFAGNPDAYFAQGGPTQWLSAGVTNLRGVYWEVERDTLIAIPLFVFMGIMLQRSKIAEDLLVTMAQLFGPVPGGLGISVVFVGALLAATTGILGATVVAMGLISLPAMRRNNYSNSLSTGTIAASGTLGQIIPPSIVLIILADQLASATDQASTARKALYKDSTGELTMPSAFDVGSTSAGEMFLGAFLPGLVLVGLYMLFILILALIRPNMAPAVPFAGKMDFKFVSRVIVILVPPLTLIFVVLGSIIAGIATVNQAGAIGAVGATIMAGYRLYDGKRTAYWPAILAIISIAVIIYITNNHPVNIKNITTPDDTFWLMVVAIASAVFVFSFLWSLYRTLVTEDTLGGVMLETAKTTSLVFIILLGAAMLTAAFRAFGGEELVREFLTSLPGGFWLQFIIVMAVIFLLGFFLDFIEIAVVVVPIVAPILLMDPGANITAVWLGVMIGLNIQTSFLTPPFGFALFYLRGVAPAAVKTIQMYKGVIPFICLQLCALGIVGYLPWLVNYLPARMSLVSETAPPPVNPRLQYCIENYTFDIYQTEGDAIRNAIAGARQWDLSYLPKKLQDATEESFDDAEATFDLMTAINEAELAVSAAAPAYQPLHTQVRHLQQQMRKLDAEAAELDDILNLLQHNDADSPRIAIIEGQLSELEARHKALEDQIPANWQQQHDVFAKLQKAENQARNKYRRTADSAYEPVVELKNIIADNEKLATFQQEFNELAALVASQEPEQAAETIADFRSKLKSAEGTSKISSALNKARKAVKSKNPNPEQAQQELAKALQLYQDDLSWRQQAADELLSKLQSYADAIRDTIGLRSLPRLPKEQALYVASCSSGHRDISLNF